ncbi:DUF397 domain-containing protein [Nonomuraea sp. NPDC050783]|uniref:DUF397 domain-containing protein n=1 Tax=Nonomuraea sp. NPDC050783 TaxID=3154634 RepID=UPI0034659434
MTMRPGSGGAPQWRISSHCNSGSCVQVALLPTGTVGVRDTKDADGPILTFSTGDWEDFVKRVRDNTQA